MLPQIQTCRRRGVLATILLTFLALLLNGASAAPSPSPDSVAPLDEAATNTTLQDLSHLYIDVDASCVGYEGQWNCLSNKFQHCSGGKWTEAVSCTGNSGSASNTAETLCTPLGRTDLVEFMGECSAAWGWGNSGGGSGWGTRCSGNRCYYGAGSSVSAGKWVYPVVVGVVALRFW
ncbi:hypothetical protein EsH8_I_001385 [Colletotrichum jinshuiense]